MITDQNSLATNRLARSATRSVTVFLLCTLFVWNGSPSAAANETRKRSGDASGAPLVVLLLRHAEKAGTPKDDPPLTAAGRDRADALARLLADAGVTHLYSSEYRRTRETLQPLASRLSLDIRTLPARRIEAIVEAIQALPPGSVVVLAGHSNTLPSLLRSFGVTSDGIGRLDERGFIPDDVFDRLYILAWSAHDGDAGPAVVRISLPDR